MLDGRDGLKQCGRWDVQSIPRCMHTAYVCRGCPRHAVCCLLCCRCAKAHWKCHKTICKRLQQDPEQQQAQEQAQRQRQSHAQQQHEAASAGAVEQQAAAAAAVEQQAAEHQAAEQVDAPAEDDFASWGVK